MATLIALHGLPRSGKSTVSQILSRQLAAPIVNQDSIRLALHGQVYAKEAEPFTRAIKKVMIAALFGAGHEYVIADETHYSRASRDFVRDGPWQTYFYEVPTDWKTCLDRAVATKQPWLYNVIKEMRDRHEPLQADEQRWPSP
jgi:predicted kinase